MPRYTSQHTLINGTTASAVGTALDVSRVSAIWERGG